MATRTAKHEWISKGVCKSTWTGLLNTDDGSYLDAVILPTKTVQVSGTFGAGGSVTIEDENGAPLHDARGGTGATNAVAITAAGVVKLSENPLKLRPRVTAGDGTSTLTVVIISESPQR